MLLILLSSYNGILIAEKYFLILYCHMKLSFTIVLINLSPLSLIMDIICLKINEI